MVAAGLSLRMGRTFFFLQVPGVEEIQSNPREEPILKNVGCFPNQMSRK